MVLSKVSIIGAGNVGATCAQRIVEKGYADVVLVDIIEGLPQGKALDILQSAPVLNFNSCLIGTNSFEETAGSDVVVITSGIGRKPGMSRDELLLTNKDIVAGVIRRVATHSPQAIIVMVTNPVDAMTYLALHISQFPRQRVFGLSGALDTARLKTLIAAELKVTVGDISGCVMGQHGGNMVIVPRLVMVNGTPLTELLSPPAIDKLIERTINAGAEIVGLLKTGSAFYAPSAAVVQMVEAVVRDEKKIIPCAVWLDGEYDITDAVIGVPVKLGSGGIEQVIELELTDEEKADLASSAAAVRELVEVVKLE